MTSGLTIFYTKTFFIEEIITNKIHTSKKTSLFYL